MWLNDLKKSNHKTTKTNHNGMKLIAKGGRRALEKASS